VSYLYYGSRLPQSPRPRPLLPLACQIQPITAEITYCPVQAIQPLRGDTVLPRALVRGVRIQLGRRLAVLLAQAEAQWALRAVLPAARSQGLPLLVIAHSHEHQIRETR